MAEDIKNNVTDNTEEKTETATNTAPTKSAEEELKELKASLAKANALVSKANSEAADWKRKYTSTLDEAKAAALKAEEQRNAELEELKSLRADKRARKLMEAGYDSPTAGRCQCAEQPAQAVCGTAPFRGWKVRNGQSTRQDFWAVNQN